MRSKCWCWPGVVNGKTGCWHPRAPPRLTHVLDGNFAILSLSHFSGLKNDKYTSVGSTYWVRANSPRAHRILGDTNCYRPTRCNTFDSSMISLSLLHGVSRTVGSVSDVDDGRENIDKKINFCPFKLYCLYLDSVNLSNAGDFSLSWILRTLSILTKRKGVSSSYVHVLHESSH